MSEAEKLPEVWMRGPIENIHALLQPVAFALLQAREEVAVLMEDFPEVLLWLKPAGLASPGFHLQHMAGVIDRLFTYADNRPLSDNQLQYLSREGKPEDTSDVSFDLVEKFNNQVDVALTHLKAADVNTLTDVRGVGRKKLPTTVIGLYTHAAEHIMRHTGQLLVTIKVLKATETLTLDNRLTK